jgi:hypothetical protein
VPSLADGARTDCGGDAYTFAEVVPAHRGGRAAEPIMVLPDTLCADLAGSPGVKIESLNVFLDQRPPADDQSQASRARPMRPDRRH